MHNGRHPNSPNSIVSISPVSVAVVGARGYSGLELTKILLNHPLAKVSACFATDSEWKLADYLSSKNAASVPISAMKDLPALASTLHSVFLATPAEVSLELTPMLLANGCNVIDLSGAYRITQESFLKWYGHEHTSADLLSHARFGLVPWDKPFSAKGSMLIANPGCYATSVLMAILPLLKAGVIQADTLVIDAKSGATGAGRKAAENLLFTEVDGECLPYRVGKHQHLPEICEITEKLVGVKIDPMFTTHLLPVRRGIISGIYARLSQGMSAVDVEKGFKDAYADYPMVKFDALQKRGQLASLKRVVGTPHSQISFSVEGNKLYLFSVIDNLLKGAASQAVENFNRLMDLPVATGLSSLEGIL